MKHYENVKNKKPQVAPKSLRKIETLKVIEKALP